ncbi:MAG: hypothetical protein GX589_05475 [Deltaproteobacteria bacterium]|nr:hypothetical protein [Deltaproteobacteria bacterium]
MGCNTQKGLALLESAALLTVMGVVVWFGFGVVAYLQGISDLREIVNRHAAAINIKPFKMSAGNQAYFLSGMNRDTGDGSDSYPLQAMLDTHATAIQNDVRAWLGCSKKDCRRRYAVVVRLINMSVDMIDGKLTPRACSFKGGEDFGALRETLAQRGLLGKARTDSFAGALQVLRQGCSSGTESFQYAVPGPLYNVRMLQYYGQTEVRSDEMGGVERWDQKPINFLRRAVFLQVYVQADLSNSFLVPGFARWLASGRIGSSRDPLILTDQRVFAARQEL